MPTSAANDPGKHPSKKVITELLENPQRKNKLDMVFMEYISKLWGDNLPFTEKELDWYEPIDEKVISPGRIDEELGSLINTIRATILKGRL